MGKRKQADFQKTKLKVGRKLPKGRNVTDTSFKTKQIITPDQSFVALGDKPLTTLLSYLNTKNVVQKLDTLTKIHNYIKEHTDTLSLYFPDILSKLGNAALESDPKIPALAVEVIITCLKLLTDLQYQTFSKAMVLHLNCMMSHGAIAVKQVSLKVLKALLDNHPKVVTQHPKILFNLLNMISSLKGKLQIRRLDDLVNNAVASYAWHQEVLKAVNHFLQEMMKPEDAADEDAGDGDQRVVYWDGKAELYLPLYGAGGPEKVDLSWYASIMKPDDRECKKFVFELLDLLSDVVRGEIPRISQRQQEMILPATDVKYLNLIVKLLCNAAEFAQQHLELEEDEVKTLTKRFQDIISLQLWNGFPYAQHGNVITSKKKKGANGYECIHLNSGIFYLYTMFILESHDNAKQGAKRDDLINDFVHVIQTHVFNDESLILYLKTSRILMKSNCVNLSYKESLMVSLLGILEQNMTSVMRYSWLNSILMDITMDEKYCDIFLSNGIRNWFEFLFLDLNFMMKSGIDIKRLNYVKQMCCRKHPLFIEVLNKREDTELIRLLCYDNEDFQIAIIHLILAKNISSSFLNDLSNLICQNDAITLKMSIRLIYHLHTRYSKPGVTEKERLLFVKFLINTACDIRSLYETETDFENAEVMDILFSVLGKTRYRIRPTKKWKTHQKIFEACIELLVLYCEPERMAQAVLVFAQTFLNTGRKSIPVHVVLAFLLIRLKFGYLFEDHSVMNSAYNLVFSSFMYISIMVSKVGDQAKLYCVSELQQHLLGPLSAHEVAHMIKINANAFTKLEISEFFYVLKVIMFLNTNGKVNPREHYMNNFFRGISGVVSQSPILLPVWRKICNA